jgi:hypothetical protein
LVYGKFNGHNHLQRNVKVYHAELFDLREAKLQWLFVKSDANIAQYLDDFNSDQCNDFLVMSRC